LDGVVEGRKLKRFVKRVVALGPLVHNLQNIHLVKWELFKRIVAWLFYVFNLNPSFICVKHAANYSIFFWTVKFLYLFESCCNSGTIRKR
jgi:hypothetical protein